MKQKICYAVFIAGLSCALAQTSGQLSVNSSGGGANIGSNAQISYLIGSIGERDNKLSNREYGIQGSAYTSEKFKLGKLYYDDKFEGEKYYRYNAYNEEIEVADSSMPSSAVNLLNRDKKISLISSNGNRIQFKTYIDKKNRTQNGYLTNLREGKYTFYKRVDVKYTEGQKAQNSFIPAVPARFSKFIEYYIQIEGIDRIDELELNTRKFLKLVPEKDKESTKKFMKENNLKIKSEYDVYKVLEFLNSN